MVHNMKFGDRRGRVRVELRWLGSILMLMQLLTLPYAEATKVG